MKIALIGATGFVGSAILREALDRGHEIKALVRNPEKLTVSHEKLSVEQGNAMDIDRLAAQLSGNDIVISAYNAGWGNPNLYQEFLQGAQNIQESVKKSGVKRLLVVGGGGSLFISPDLQIVDTPDFPSFIKPGAMAARDYLNILRKEEELDWTFVSPAPGMHQGTSGTRRGTYRTGLDTPLMDEDNNPSGISVEDVAVAVLDEAEHPKHIKQRFTVAY
ncbi:MAG TPA: NAD(P)H-binding protein [Cyclobacteriaceae bacterium]|nr:NAD(P)H-binding protein [Cyclobacteriaceae bacterium]